MCAHKCVVGNIGELVVPCQSGVTVVCPEGGQTGAGWGRGICHILPFFLYIYVGFFIIINKWCDKWSEVG